MAQAKKDQNFVSTLIAVSDADSTTPIVIEGDASSAGLNVNIVSDDVGIGGGIQYDIQDVQGATDTGMVSLVVRNDTLADLSGGDGAYAPLQVNSSGALYISAASLPLPSGAATSAKQLGDGHNVTVDNISTNEVFVRGGGTAGSATDGEVVAVQGIASGTAMAVTESSPISGFATSSGQLADGHNVTVDNLISNEVYVRGSGTAGSADAAVLTIQGIASMTALSVTESSPISGFALDANWVADGGADGKGILIQGDDGTNRKNINVDATTGDLQVDLTASTAVVGKVRLVTATGGEVTEDTDDSIKVTIVADDVSLATSSGQLADGHAVTIDNISTNEVFIRGSQAAGSPVDNEVVTIQGIASMTALSVTESSPISGFATSANQLADGHNVTIDNASVTVSNTSIDGDGAPAIDSIIQVAINLNAGADQVLVASAPNKQIWVYAVAYTLSVAGTVSFQDEGDIAITGIMDHAANSGMAVGPSGNFAMPIWKLGTDKDLEVDVVTASLDGWITYAIVSV